MTTNKIKILILISIILSMFTTITVFAGTTLSVTYKDDSGNTLMSADTISVNVGQSYSQVAPKITDYVAVNWTLDGVKQGGGSQSEIDSGITASISSVPNTGGQISFIYEADTNHDGIPDINQSTLFGYITIYYYDYDSHKLLDTIYQRNLKVGSTYNYSIVRRLYAKDYGYDYTYSDSTPSDNGSGNVPIVVSSSPSANIISVYYTKNNSANRTLTITSFDASTGRQLNTKSIINLEVNSTYTYIIPTIDGYKFDYSNPNAVNGRINKVIEPNDNDNIISVYYVKGDSGAYTDTNSSGYSFNGNHASSTDTYYTAGFNGSKINPTISSKVTITAKGLFLNTNEDYSIISGYPDGTFRPDQNITRGETAEMFYSIIANPTNLEKAQSFSDVPSSDKYFTAINYLAATGVVSGYTDGTFHPNDSITREEFITIATKITGFGDVNGGLNFSDVPPDRWSYPYIKAGSWLNLANGYSDATYRPTNYITRAEATRIGASMIGRNINNTGRTNHFSDLNESHWAYNYIINSSF